MSTKKLWSPKMLLVFALAVTALLSSALVMQAPAATQAIPEAPAYEGILGKSLTDRAVDDFIVTQRCSSQGQFQVCNDAGISLWIGLDQRVETVYLYPSAIHDFGAYKGTLPLGLSPRNTRANVEAKLGQPKVEHVLQAGWAPGLPDENATPDHARDWAVYKRFGVTIIYNSPSATDKAATIYAVLVSK